MDTSVLPETLKLIDAFLRSDRADQSAWIGNWIYLAAGPYIDNEGKEHRTIYIPDILLYPRLRGQGIFTKTLKHLEANGKQFDFTAIAVINIINIRLQSFLQRNGYVRACQASANGDDVYKLL